MTLLLSLSPAYGREIFIPECDLSRSFADLLEQKTLTRGDLEKIRALGYKIELKPSAKVEL